MAYTLTTTPTGVAESQNTGVTVGARLVAWYTGNSDPVTVHVRLQYINQGVYYYGTSKDYELHIWKSADVRQDIWATAWPNPLPAYSGWQYVPDGNSPAELTMSVARGASISANGKVWTYEYDDAWTPNVLLVVPANVAPSGLYGSNVAPSTEGFSAEVGITAWNGGNGHWRALTVYTQGYSTAILSSLDSSASLVSTITASNTTHTSGNPTLQPNTYYSLKVSASNYLAQANVNLGDYATLPSATTVSVGATTDTDITISYTTGADGGALVKSLEYSLDNGATWQTGATVSTGTATSGTYTISGLTPETTYSIQTRTTTTSGSTAGVTLSGTTTLSYKLYGSVQTAVTTVSGDIRSGGEGNITAFDVNTFLSKMESDGRYTDSIEYVKVTPSNQDHGKYLISIYYVDEAHSTVMITPPVVYANMSSYGMTAKPPETATYGYDYIDFTYTTTTQSVSKQITKLYGSVNGQTKEIVKLYGSVNGVTKRIF